MKISIACDHGGLELKELVKRHLTELGHEVADFGTHTHESCDYPDFAAAAARAVASGECERGVVICTTGIGVSIAANKIHGIRCALLTDTVAAEATRRHNDANMIALGQHIVAPYIALQIVDIWLSTPFDGGERHVRRIRKIAVLEEE